jgi:hypothetical protein
MPKLGILAALAVVALIASGYKSGPSAPKRDYSDGQRVSGGESAGYTWDIFYNAQLDAFALAFYGPHGEENLGVFPTIRMANERADRRINTGV